MIEKVLLSYIVLTLLTLTIKVFVEVQKVKKDIKWIHIELDHLLRGFTYEIGARKNKGNNDDKY